MWTISTNLRWTLNEWINVNQWRDFSDLGAWYVTNPLGFVDNLAQLAMTANNTWLLTISKGCAWVSYIKNADQAYMKCELTQNYSLPFSDPDGLYFLWIEINPAIFGTGSLIADGSDYFKIKRGLALPVSGYFCPLYNFSKTGTAIAIVTDLREQRDVRFRDIQVRDIIARNITAEKITTDEIVLPSGDLQTTLNTITTLASWVSLQGLPVMAWENLSARDGTFIEENPNFAESTVWQNVWDIIWNTRVDIVWFTSAEISSTMIVKVWKTGWPIQDFLIRVEWDTAMLANWMLAHPNATWTIAQNTINVSMALWWSGTTQSVSSIEWFRFTALTSWFINAVDKAANCTATTCFFRRVSDNQQIWSVSFVWNTATFVSWWLFFEQWIQYDLLVWSGTIANPLWYIRSIWSQVLPLANVNINVTTWVSANAWPILQQTNITRIETSNGKVNFLWPFSIPRWQKVHTTVRQVGDFINVANYYTIYGANKNTSTRIMRKYNGTTWSNVESTQTYTKPITTITFTNLEIWLEFGFNRAWVIKTVTRWLFGATKATRLFIRNASWVLLFWPFTFVTDTFTFPTPIAFWPWNILRIWVDNNGANYNCNVWNGFWTIPLWISGIADYGNAVPWGWILNIWYDVFNDFFVPITTSLLENQLLSLTNILYTHKTSLYWLSTRIYNEWQDAIVYREWEIDWFTWLVSWLLYSLTSVLWWIGIANSKVCIWYAKNPTTLILRYANNIPLNTSLILFVTTVPWAIPPWVSSAWWSQSFSYTTPVPWVLRMQWTSQWTRWGDAFHAVTTYWYSNFSITNTVSAEVATLPNQSQFTWATSITTTQWSWVIAVQLSAGQTVTFTVNSIVEATTWSPAAWSSSSRSTLSFTNFSPIN